MQHPFMRSVLAAAVLSTLSVTAYADTSVEERLKAMETRLNALETENQALKGQLKSTEQKVEATSAQVEKVASNPSSTKASWAENTRIGGYGELHYNNLEDQHGTNDKDEIDFHRFVLFLVTISARKPAFSLSWKSSMRSSKAAKGRSNSSRLILSTTSTIR